MSRYTRDPSKSGTSSCGAVPMIREKLMHGVPGLQWWIRVFVGRMGGTSVGTGCGQRLCCGCIIYVSWESGSAGRYGHGGEEIRRKKISSGQERCLPVAPGRYIGLPPPGSRGLNYAGEILSLMGAEEPGSGNGKGLIRKSFSWAIRPSMLLFLINGIFRGAGSSSILAMRGPC